MFKDVTYRPEYNLSMRFYFAEAEKARATVIFYFGGGWSKGNPLQFEPFAQRLSAIGFNVALPDYRVRERYEGCKPRMCVEDAIAAAQFLADHSDEYGVDPDRFVFGGGSAGGHLALCTELLGPFRAVGLLLYNPAAVIPDLHGMHAMFGDDLKALSPIDLIDRAIPPTVIFHGLDDTTVPIAGNVRFAEIARSYGSHVEIIGYVGKKHGFFNLSPARENVIEQTVEFAQKYFM